MENSSIPQDEIISQMKHEICEKDAELKSLRKQLEKKERLLSNTQKYNEDLLNQNKVLSKTLQNVRNAEKRTDAATQTSVENFQDAADLNSWAAQSENNNISVAECVRAAAEEALAQTNFTFDEESGYYYDSISGYYYDSENQLYYDSTSGIYYSYDYENGSYKFHSQIDISQFYNHSEKNAESPIKENKRKHKRHAEKKKQKSSKEEIKDIAHLESKTTQSEKLADDFQAVIPENNGSIKTENGDDSVSEEGECSSSSSDDSEDETSSLSDESKVNQSPPCIRCMVEESSVETIPKGNLYIVTCSGATVGRNTDNDMYLPDLQISKIHAKFKYDPEQNYTITDVGSQNGTFLNGNRLSKEKEQSAAYKLMHDDVLEFPSIKFRLHIHIGLETCDQCEPGQVKAVLEAGKQKTHVILSKDEKEKLRRIELKQIKKKFGLEAMTFEDSGLPTAGSEYVDRAKKRRKIKGSQNPYEKTEAASLDIAISEKNKGFKMLKKMGWSEGDSLGKSQAGILEPIPIVSKAYLD